MKKPEGSPVELVFPAPPGGSPIPAGTGRFHETGQYPSDYPKFFARYCEGKEVILEGSKVGGGLGVRAQVGGGEGHSEVSLSPCLMRASLDPNNPWGITPDDVSERVVGGVRMIDWTLIDFLAIYGRQGLREAMKRYGSGSEKPAQPGPAAPTTGADPGAEARTLRLEIQRVTREAGEYMTALTAAREKLTEAMAEREAARQRLDSYAGKILGLLSELDARAKGMKKAAGTKPKGVYQQALVKAAEGLEKTIAAYREKAGA